MIHPSAEVLTREIGEGTKVWQNAVILKDAVVGKNCNVNCNVFIENDVLIGNNVTIKSGVQIWDGITIEDDVFIGPNATFTNDVYPRSKIYPESFKKTLVEEGASIGANATVIAGITIGRFSLIGAGSVVTKSIPPFTIWYGNPAIHKGYITRDGIAVNNSLRDRTGRIYKLKNEEPTLV